MRTLEPMLPPPGPLSWEPIHPGPSRRWMLWFAPLVAVATLVLGSQVEVPYVALAPGTARQINDLVRVPKDKAHPPKGEILLTTVSFQQRMTLLDTIIGWAYDDIDVFPREQILGKVSPNQFRQMNLQAIDDSKERAVVMAMRRLGYTITEHGEGTLVEGVQPETPADGLLNPGDVITKVDGTPTPLHQDFRAVIQQRKPGDVVEMEVLAATGGPPRTVRPRLAAREDGSAIVGIAIRTKGLKYDMPFEVTIESLGIGGPSAGLAFCLEVIDALTPGELTGAHRVAVTGELFPGGEVGPIGGIAQKVAAVKAADAEYFLVPAGNYEVAKSRAGDDVQIIRVSTLEEALTALGRLGGDLTAIGPPPGTTSPMR